MLALIKQGLLAMKLTFMGAIELVSRDDCQNYVIFCRRSIESFACSPNRRLNKQLMSKVIKIQVKADLSSLFSPYLFRIQDSCWRMGSVSS